MSLTGYDNIKQKYHSVWIDDMHTAGTPRGMRSTAAKLSRSKASMIAR
jgi:hypothetical protein